MIASAVFWASLVLLGWAWAGYPALLQLAATMRKVSFRQTPRDSGPDLVPCLPHVTVMVPVHNAERDLAGKLHNCLHFDYPADRFTIIIGSDGSTDRTEAIAREHAADHRNVQAICSGRRVGKSVMQNLMAQHADGDVLLLTDVGAKLQPDALSIISRLFQEPDIGCVSGHVIWHGEPGAGRAPSDNLYWRFEHTLWTHETSLRMLGWASGPCMAVRRRLFRELDPRYGDDVIIPLDVIDQGARVVYEPALMAYDSSIDQPAAALRARSRMTLRSLQATMARGRVFQPLRRPRLFVSVVSHKLLRWATPFLFIAALGSAVPLSMSKDSPAQAVLILQTTGIAMALAGFLRRFLPLRVPAIGVAHDFALENIGIMIGVVRALLGHTIVAYRQEK